MLAQKDVQLPCLLVDPCWPCSMFTIFYLLLAFFTGGIIPFQTAANSNLKQQMSSPLLASFVNCTVGSIALFIIMMLSTEESFYRSPEEWASYDWWMYTSGALGAIILMVAMTLLSDVLPHLRAKALRGGGFFYSGIYSRGDRPLGYCYIYPILEASCSIQLVLQRTLVVAK